MICGHHPPPTRGRDSAIDDGDDDEDEDGDGDGDEEDGDTHLICLPACAYRGEWKSGDGWGHAWEST